MTTPTVSQGEGGDDADGKPGGEGVTKPTVSRGRGVTTPMVSQGKEAASVGDLTFVPQQALGTCSVPAPLLGTWETSRQRFLNSCPCELHIQWL